MDRPYKEDICAVNDVYCIALVFSKDQYRYRNYAVAYVEVLLRMQKQVAVFSPFWLELKNILHTSFRDQARRIHCFPLENIEPADDNIAYIRKRLYLNKCLHEAELLMQMKIDFVFFAPLDDWIKPGFGRKWLDWIFKYTWSGILTQMNNYRYPGLKLNVDPGFSDPDYLLTSQNCVGVCTLDRFRSEALKSRVYKKVVVMPDVSPLPFVDSIQKTGIQIRKMAKGRMVVGQILLEQESPDHLIELALQASPQQYFFVCAGNIQFDALPESTYLALNQILGSGKENVYFNLQEQYDTESIHDILRSFDVCFVNDGHLQMPHPLLVPAAHLGIPVIGSGLDITGELLEAFETGTSVNGSLKDSLRALEELRGKMPFEKNLNQQKMRNYAKLQSKEALQEAWEMLLMY